MCVNLPDDWQKKPNITLDECIADYFKVEAIGIAVDGRLNSFDSESRYDF